MSSEPNMNELLKMNIVAMSGIIVNNTHCTIGNGAGKSLHKFSILEKDMAFKVLKICNELLPSLQSLQDDEFQSWIDEPGYY